VSESAAEWPAVGLTLRVDGHEYPVPQVWIGDSLLAVLRERLDLDEPRDGCAVGECGSCLVTLDGRPAAACLIPAVAAAGASPCGFCAPALTVAITDLLRRNADPGPAAIREALAGIVCRCAESGRWIEAVAQAKEIGFEDAGARPGPGDSGELPMLVFEAGEPA
jgi:aerobic-type carbon monoxide dehydrogenase small subunit (CoxS/CutS family)